MMGGCPHYNVWRQGLVGTAELRRAEQNKQIAVQEAQAKLDSAKLLSDAEIERARGVAEANKIIGDSLKGNEGYLRYLWIQGLQTNQMQVIYVPTEAGLPILEAGKRSETYPGVIPNE
jgi:regulator of protease activity HflC (stomatin/prohibitin superfamily)